jgi:hypothetical protein
MFFQFEIPHCPEMQCISEVDEEAEKTLQNDALLNISKAQERQQSQYLKKQKKPHQPIVPGSKVLKFNARKKGRKGDTLGRNYAGPYTVVSLKGTACTLEKDGRILKQAVSMDHLKLYIPEGQLCIYKYTYAHS